MLQIMRQIHATSQLHQTSANVTFLKGNLAQLKISQLH